MYSLTYPPKGNIYFSLNRANLNDCIVLPMVKIGTKCELKDCIIGTGYEVKSDSKLNFNIFLVTCFIWRSLKKH